MLTCLIACMLAACSPTAPTDLTGDWRATVHDANAAPPIISVTFHLALVQEEELLTGIAEYGGAQLLIAGLCDESQCKVRALSAKYSAMLWVLTPHRLGFRGRVFGSGFSFGVIDGVREKRNE